MITATDGIHIIEKLNDRTWRIDESGIANCYLLIGDNKALLIDSGDGVGDIGATVRQITKLPATLAVTHGHCDHAGGRNCFTEYYVPRGDSGLIYRIMSSPTACKTLLKNNPEFKLSKKPYHAKSIYFDETMTFDLGNRLITVKTVPGHTAGSTVFIDEKYHQLFSGDDVNTYLWMQLPGATILSAWLTGARQIEQLSATYSVYGGHGDGRLTQNSIQQLISLVEKLLQEKPEVKEKNLDYPSNTAAIHVLVAKNKIC